MAMVGNTVLYLTVRVYVLLISEHNFHYKITTHFFNEIPIYLLFFANYYLKCK